MKMRHILGSLCNKRSSWFSVFRCLTAQKNEAFLSNQRTENQKKTGPVACYAVHIRNQRFILDIVLEIHSFQKVVSCFLDNTHSLNSTSKTLK